MLFLTARYIGAALLNMSVIFIGKSPYKFVGAGFELRQLDLKIFSSILYCFIVV